MDRLPFQEDIIAVELGKQLTERGGPVWDRLFVWKYLLLDLKQLVLPEIFRLDSEDYQNYP